jgi:hypothetical protein
MLEREDANVASMMDVAATELRICMVFHPDTGQIVACNLAVLVRALKATSVICNRDHESYLCALCNIDADILAVAYIAVLHPRIRTRLVDAYRSTD